MYSYSSPFFEGAVSVVRKVMVVAVFDFPSSNDWIRLRLLLSFLSLKCYILEFDIGMGLGLETVVVF